MSSRNAHTDTLDLIEAFWREFHIAVRAHAKGDVARARLLFYSLQIDLSRIHTALLEEWFLERCERADPFTAPSAPAEPGEAR